MAHYIGWQLLKQEPSNLAVHYLLGNCFVKFSQWDKAKLEYSYCAQVGLGSPIGKVARTALDQVTAIQLGGQNGSPQSTSAVPSKAPVVSSDAAAGETSAAPEAPPPDAVDIQTLEYKERILKQGADLIAANKDKLQRQIETINSQTDLAIRGVADGVPNQNSGVDRERLMREATAKIKMLEDNNVREEQKITAYYQAQANNISSQKGNLASQAQLGKGDIRIQPKGTGLFVHNYINYHGEVPLPPPPPELKATALKLGTGVGAGISTGTGTGTKTGPASRANARGSTNSKSAAGAGGGASAADARAKNQ